MPLPPEAIQLLKNAAAVDAKAPAGDSEKRRRVLDYVIDTLKQQYPHCFLAEESDQGGT